MKHFDLKPVLALLNTFTTSVRENVLDAFASMREQVRLLWVESWMDNEHGIILLCQCNISWTAGWWLSRETWTSVLCMCSARAPFRYMTVMDTQTSAWLSVNTCFNSEPSKNWLHGHCHWLSCMRLRAILPSLLVWGVCVCPVHAG